MAEYIDRNIALDAVKRTCGDYAAAFAEIARTPSADVVPVVKGEWEWQEEWETDPNTYACELQSCGWYCTSCGIELGEYLSKAIGQRIEFDDDFSKPDLKYCPNCGCRMLGGDKDDPISDKQRD